MRRASLLAVLAALLAPAVLAAPASGADDRLLAGVGRADITPPTGYAFGGYVRADRRGKGVHTRLESSALVLQRGDRKVALVALDLFMVPGGLVKEAAERNADIGLSEENVLVSASHTHSGPSGFANFRSFNALAPSTETTTDPQTFFDFFNAPPADPQLYRFLVERLALALRRAATSVKPAVAGWGRSELTGVTRNRSIEAHLADHGIVKEVGEGSAAEDPEGEIHTIDADVDVLRVDRLEVRKRKARKGRKARRVTVRVPMGGWSSFANHGTVVEADYGLYNQDHHGAAIRVFERRVRETAKVPASKPIVNVYGNGNEGDQSAGTQGQGIDLAERVGRAEADAMFRAWQQAGRAMSRDPALDLRWTRVCFCGQDVGDGRRVADEPVAGIPFLTGSEEGRGPLHDETGVPFEGRRSLVGSETQGHKIAVNGATSKETVPGAVPLMTVRIGDRMIASMPGEPTVEVGRRVEAAILRVAGGAGVTRAITSGLANEFILYFTTPEEYDRQHYEGGSTLYGPHASVLMEQQLTELAARMARGEPAQEAYPFDPRNGIRPDGPEFPDGARSATAEGQPGPVNRSGKTFWSWRGAPRGFDMPLDRAFVSIERRVRGRWRHHDSDQWLHTTWSVDDEGRYIASWTARPNAPLGQHRFVITGKHYRLVSDPFEVRP